MTAWNTPATVACGDLDVRFLAERSREVADRLPKGRQQILPGVARLPQLENPAAIGGT